MPCSNLERFLQCVTPIVPSKLLPQSNVNELNSLWQQPGNRVTVEYIKLEDVWECYNEWSAYGIGTQLHLNNGDSIMQYYVPYLSAIQIFTNKSALASRNVNPVAEDNEAATADFECDSWSDDSVSDKLSQSLSNNSSRTWDSTSDDSSLDHGPTARDPRLGYLYLQYFEMASPCWRIPLVEKIHELAVNFPGLMTLKNVDLSPASWMAVAWYPIYHIPAQKNEKDLSACFLTYHTLSSSFQDCGDENDEMTGRVDDQATRGERRRKGGGEIRLRPFGMASYKMQGDLWLKSDNCEMERLIYLYSAADSWLKQLNVNHHDYNFFTYHSLV